jgi:hypothetical protein
MDRGVIVGGGLIAASFLVAVLLNRSAREEAAAAPPPKPPVQVCDRTLQTPPIPGQAPPAATAADCKAAEAEPLKP